MARRIGDPELTLTACLNAAIAVWRAWTASWRLQLTTEAVALARELGDGINLTSSSPCRPSRPARGEIALLDEAMALARAEADRLRHVYAQLVLDSLEVSWASMRATSTRSRRSSTTCRRSARSSPSPGSPRPSPAPLLMPAALAGAGTRSCWSGCSRWSATRSSRSPLR